MDADRATEKSKSVEEHLPLWVADDTLARALDGLRKAMENARTELDRLAEHAGCLTKETAGV